MNLSQKLLPHETIGEVRNFYGHTDKIINTTQIHLESSIENLQSSLLKIGILLDTNETQALQNALAFFDALLDTPSDSSNKMLLES